MYENNGEGLLVRAEPLVLAEEVAQKMVKTRRRGRRPPPRRRPCVGMGDQHRASKEGLEGPRTAPWKDLRIAEGVSLQTARLRGRRTISHSEQ